MVFKKIIFQNRYVALETSSRPPPFMENTILNFHFDYLNPSLMFSKVMTDGKSVRELFQELSPDALASLVDYYKDDFVIGGYNHSIF